VPVATADNDLVRVLRRNRRDSRTRWGRGHGGGGSLLLLMAGYGLAVPTGARLVPAVRDRNGAVVAAFEVGTALVVAGLALRRRWLPAAANAAALAGVGAWWVAARPAVA
jgi:hypothetical protein